jgi:hypothetical protein
MCKVGQFIHVKFIRFRGGRTYVFDVNGKKYLMDDKLGPDLEDRLNTGIFDNFNPFIIDEENAIVTLSNYLALVKYFYEDYGVYNKFGRYSSGKHLKIWKTRWRQTAVQKGYIIRKNVSFNFQKGVCLPRTKKHIECEWMVAVWCNEKGIPQWVMPVFSPILKKHLEDHPELEFVPLDHFYDFFHRYTKHSFFTPHEYFREEKMTRECELKKNGDLKKFKLILHGFLHPSTLHYKFWDHVLGHKNIHRYGSKNSQAWHQIIGNEMPDTGKPEIRQFENLDQYHVPRSFRYSDNHEFNMFHQAIKNGIRNYLQKLSSLFLESPTILLQHVDDHQLDISWCLVNMLGYGNEKDEHMEHLPFLAMQGICYNWQDEVPTIHLFVKTFYLRFFNIHKSMIQSFRQTHHFQSLHNGRPVRQWRTENAYRYA